MTFRRWLRRALRPDPDFLPRMGYAQDGEDLILDRLLGGQAQGVYVDIGAHHPMRFSNTYLFYQRGWKGLNVDAQPGSMGLFKRMRPRDTNIEVGVGALSGAFPYFRFNEPALNTFEAIEARAKNVPPHAILDVIDVQVRTLAEILAEHLPADTLIDSLSVDVEGHDLDVLQSNDWLRFRPRFILAETLRTNLLALSNCPVANYLSGVGYEPIARAYNTTLFKDRVTAR